MTERLRAAGVPVIGYVDTDYGNRPAGQIMHRIRPLPGLVRRERRVPRPRRDLGREPGVLRARCRRGCASWEPGSCSSTMAHTRMKDTPGTPTCWAPSRVRGLPTARLNVPRWTARWPGEKFYHVVYSVPPERFERSRPAGHATPRGVGLRYRTRRAVTRTTACPSMPGLRCRVDQIQQASRPGAGGRSYWGCRARRDGLLGRSTSHSRSAPPPPGRPSDRNGAVLPPAGDPRLLLLVVDLGAGRRQQAGAQRHHPGYLRAGRG